MKKIYQSKSLNYQLLKIPLIPDSEIKFFSWVESLKDRLDEVKESLRNEGVSSEFIFHEKSESKHFIYFLTSSADLEKANNVFQKSKLPIDLEAKSQILECWDLENIRALELLFAYDTAL